jgi:tetratricopeptide (TPR) repeat protein
MRMIALGLILVFSQVPLMASAQSARDQAKTLFKKGNKDFSAKRYSDALAAFKQANALSPHPVMLKNIANVYRAMYDYTRAIDFYRRYLRSKPRDSAKTRSKIGKMHAERAGWPSLKLITRPSGVAVRVTDGAATVWGRTPFTLRLPAGRHIVYLSKTGYDSLTRPLLFEAKTNRSMTFTLAASPAVTQGVAVGAAPVQTVNRNSNTQKGVAVPARTGRNEAAGRENAVKAPVETAPKTTRVVALPAQSTATQSSDQANVEAPGTGFDRRKWSWIGMGTGAAFLVGGTGLALMAMGTSGDLDTCRENPACVRTDREVIIGNDVKAQAMLADSFIAIGAVTAGLGVALYLMSRQDKADHAAIILVPSPHGVTATGLFRF